MDNKNTLLTTKDRKKRKEVDREEDGDMTGVYAGTTWTRTANKL